MNPGFGGGGDDIAIIFFFLQIGNKAIVAHGTEIRLLEGSSGLWKWWNYEEYKRELMSLHSEREYVGYIVRVADATASDLKQFETFIYGPKDQLDEHQFAQDKLVKQLEEHLLKSIPHHHLLPPTPYTFLLFPVPYTPPHPSPAFHSINPPTFYLPALRPPHLAIHIHQSTSDIVEISFMQTDIPVGTPNWAECNRYKMMTHAFIHELDSWDDIRQVFLQ